MCRVDKLVRRRSSIESLALLEDSDPFSDSIMSSSTSKTRNNNIYRASDKIMSKQKQCIQHNYHDHSYDHNPCSHLDEGALHKNPSSKGGVTIPFPSKLYKMLDHIHSKEPELAEIVSWQPHGRCFLVHKPKAFAENVLAMFFQQKKYASFQRQLNLYGFSRITKGPDRGSYYHELFLRGKEFLCRGIIRSKIKGTGARLASNPDAEPNFYDMPPVPSARDCTKPYAYPVPGAVTNATGMGRSGTDTYPLSNSAYHSVAGHQNTNFSSVQQQQNNIILTESQRSFKGIGTTRNSNKFMNTKMPSLNDTSSYPSRQQSVEVTSGEGEDLEFVFDNMPFHSIDRKNRETRRHSLLQPHSRRGSLSNDCSGKNVKYPNNSISMSNFGSNQDNYHDLNLSGTGINQFHNEMDMILSLGDAEITDDEMVDILERIR